MIENIEKQDNMKAQEGIGLYKINYEMQVKGSTKDHNYIAGVIAYTNEQAVQTLVKHGRQNVKGFEGMKINEVSFDGGCHAISDEVREAIIGTAVMKGIVVSKEDHEKLLVEAVKEAKRVTKKSVIPKSKKD